jgi:hypothetical protein
VGTQGADLKFLTAPSGGNPAERARITSDGNLLVGTTSASTAGSGYQACTINGANGSNIALNGGGSNIALIYAATGNSNLYIGNQTASGAVIFNAGSGTERLRIDASGNLGLGVTPSAWGSNYSAFQVGYGGNLVAGNGTFPSYVSIGANYYLDSTPTAKYLQTAESSLYQQNGGEHQWFNAPSGTAGNAITFTQAMTLDASGDLGIGTTSPTQRLHVAGGNIQVSSGTDTTIITTGGNFTTGALADSAILYQNGDLLFGPAPTERVRMTADGNLLVGTASTSPTSGNGVKVFPGTGAQVSIVGSADTNANLAMNVYSTTAAAYRFQVGWGGTVYATSTSITAISDASLKENVRDLETGLDEVMALRPRRFDWKNGDGQDVAGFIAQEVESVLPDLVSDYKYNAEETKRGLKMGDMLPTLVKAIQELKAEVDSLRAQLNP